MSDRVDDFLRDWVAENVNFSGYPGEDDEDPEAVLLAERCFDDAEAEGIPREEIQTRYGDLVSFMTQELARLARTTWN